MNYKVELTSNFKKEAKKLLKKYPSLKEELVLLGSVLADDPTYGTPLGNDVYKIRISISSKGKGKSGGARIISFVKIVADTVFLLSIYSKGDRETISDKEIQQLLKGFI